MKLKCLQFFIVGLFFSLITVGSALGYSTVVAFGDSLSDSGNIARLTDGTLWVEHLANKYSATLNNYAYAGATTGPDNPSAGLENTGLLWQVDSFGPTLGSLPPSETIITLWAGANDLLQNRPFSNAVTNIGNALESLYTEGGRNFLVPNLPDIGKTPSLLAAGSDISQGASQWTMAYNMTLDGLLYNFDNKYDDVNLFFVDTFSIFNQFEVGSDAWQELFWVDGFHPSAVGHKLIFDAAVAAAEPVPEPATLLLFATGLTALAGARQRRRNKIDK